jgi:hypothetical protein
MRSKARGADSRAALDGHYDATMERITGGKRITCVCGKVVQGKDDNELWEKAQAHIADDHPALVGKVSREDILAQAEEI